MTDLLVTFLQIGIANKVIIPAMVAVKFPDLEVNFSDGKRLKLPIHTCGDMDNADKSSIPKASLVCLSFRANSQVRNHGVVFQELIV